MATRCRKHITIKDLEACIDECYSRERDYANEIAKLEEALVEEQITNESLEDTFTLEL